jgi:hypothetical protein
MNAKRKKKNFHIQGRDIVKEKTTIYICKTLQRKGRKETYM